MGFYLPTSLAKKEKNHQYVIPIILWEVKNNVLLDTLAYNKSQIDLYYVFLATGILQLI